MNGDHDIPEFPDFKGATLEYITMSQTSKENLDIQL